MAVLYERSMENPGSFVTALDFASLKSVMFLTLVGLDTQGLSGVLDYLIFWKSSLHLVLIFLLLGGQVENNI